MKNAFYFNLKAPFILKIFKFLSWNHAENEARRLIPDIFFFFLKKKEVLYEV